MLRFRSLLILWVVFQGYARQPKYALERIEVYKPNYYRGEVILKMDYASSLIQNPQVWKRANNKQVLSVSIVFSDYPKRKAAWITNYDTLLDRRIQALKTLIPQIDSLPQVTWKVILQTACKTEAEAKELFHGIVVTYKTKIPKSVFTNYKLIRRIVSGRVSLPDSTVIKVLKRNKWRNMLIVNDWTSSMYPYGAQAILWHRLNNLDKQVKAFVFFNDGNQKKDLNKRIGETGGLWWVKADTIKTILKTIQMTMVNGDGGDTPENDIEALLYGLKQTSDLVDNIILIADNNSPIRDKVLISDLTRPVKIIICGRKNQPIHSHYLQLAHQTQGSIHTIEEDIINLTNLNPDQTLKIGRFEYQLEDGTIKLKR